MRNENARKQDVTPWISEGTTLAKYAVPMNLKPVSEFVEEYSVSQPDDNDQDHDPLPTAQTEHTMPDPTASGNHDYILWVHGWNWADWEKKDYGYSTFKRLYWLGFKGTFGIYKWPGTYGLTSALTFDESERHALMSGAGLKNLILGLKARGFNVNIYAHSQGCMVTSEALRQIALNPDPNHPNPVVDSMTFSQAAVSARMYDGSYPEYDDWGGLYANTGLPDLAWLATFVPNDYVQGVAQQLLNCPLRPEWPDLYGHFPYHLESPGTAVRFDPYFQPVKIAVKSGMMFNFYNPWDYATGRYNTESGLANRVSGSWLLDQLIKPFRIVLPLYRDRAYRMVYGGQNLTPEEKAKFTRDSTRQDYFCLGSPALADCGLPTTCSGSQIYDLSVPATKYEMLSYGCSAYSRSLGGHDPNQHLDASSGFNWQTNEVNLQTSPYNYREYVMWHGAQFRGMLAKQRSYWRQFLTNIGITP